MKQTFSFFSFIASITLLCACSPNSELAHENLILKNKIKNDSLYILSLNQELEIVYHDLDAVKFLADSVLKTSDHLRNHLISKADAENTIDQNLLNIDSLLNLSKNKINALEQRLNQSSQQQKLLANLIYRLKKELLNQQNAIEALNKQLNILASEVKGLKLRRKFIVKRLKETEQELISAQQNQALQAKQLNEQASQLATAFFIIGNKKNLANKNIIKIKGVLNRIEGLGDNLDQNLFNTIDTNQSLLKIDIGNHNIKISRITLVPSRPEEYYLFEQKHGRTYLVIINKEFWKKSKYLAIITPE
jgi:hypothetical protein